MNLKTYIWPVKFTCFLFAIMFAFLAGYPCSDGVTCAEDKNSDVQVTLSSDIPSQEEENLCSPFCICSCCRGQINSPVYFQFEAFCPKFTDQQCFANNHLVISIAYSIWQPPKLV